MTLLLIDDLRREHDFFARAVKRLNLAVQFFAMSSCEEALEKIPLIGSPLPDYIFLDLDMPMVDGYACFKMLKSHTSLKHVPVILYSSDETSPGIRHMLKNGALCHLNKSTNLSVFCNDLESIIGADTEIKPIK